MSTGIIEEKLAHKKSRKSKKNDDVSTHKEVDRLGASPVTAKVTSKQSKVEHQNGEAEPHKPTEAKVKRKRRHLGDDGDAEAAERKKKRRRKQEASLNESEVKEESKSSEHDKTIEGEGGKALESSRKKGRKKEKTQDGDGEPVKKQKRKAGCPDLPDPEDDASLASQARKALTYAYQQFDDPTSWKFNKARQNWLIRNTWSIQAIPELYMPLLARYLTNVQGGVREKLLTTCRSIISPTSTVSADTSLQLPITTTESEAAKLKQLRARVLLDALTIE